LRKATSSLAAAKTAKQNMSSRPLATAFSGAALCKQAAAALAAAAR
jgi:hypothetical protein